MVAKVRAFKSSDGSLHETEEGAFRYELKRYVESAIVEGRNQPGVPIGYAAIAVDRLLENFDEIFERMVAYKKSRPAYANKKKEKQDG